jgi:aspartyl-tRNA synthetase
LDIIEKYYINITKSIFPQKKITQEPFPILTRYDAMNMYWSDKPELRIKEFTFIESTQRAKNTDFSIFQQAKSVKAIMVPKSMSRSEVDKYETYLKQYGSKWLSRLSMTNEWLKWSIAKFINQNAQDQLPKDLPNEWTLLFQAGEWEDVVKYLWMLRTKFIQDFDLLKDKNNEVDFAFIVDFPLFELGNDWSLGAVHHPFTKPKDEDISFVKELAKKIRNWWKMTDEDKIKLLSIKADCYDIIFNWNEVWWWSIRIHDKELQHAIFTLLWLEEKQIQERFWHLLKCFEYGVPPHWWCAFGLDRTVMIYQNMENIREVIAFPKNQKYRDLMIDAPSEIDQSLLKELGLFVEKNN